MHTILYAHHFAMHTFIRRNVFLNVFGFFLFTIIRARVRFHQPVFCTIILTTFITFTCRLFN